MTCETGCQDLCFGKVTQNQMRRTVMNRRNLLLAVFGLIFILLSGCAGVLPNQTTAPTPTSTSQTNSSQALTLLKSAVSVPASCNPTPVYFGSHDNDNLAIPWVAAAPSNSGIIGYLFFARVTPVKKPNYYQPMHTGGKMPGGGATKILWKIQNAAGIGEITVSGKNLSLPHNTFQQTFFASSDGIPAIVDVPTAGCWRFDLQSGTDQAEAVFWVVP
jgi:hypothetical protein